MFKEHPSFQQPQHTEVKIWRYIDLQKFLSMIIDNSLFFTRPDKFIDKWEGSYTRGNVASQAERLRSSFMTHATDAQIEKYQSQFSNITRNQITSNYISCWHMNNRESVAMWGNYAHSGIAIQSTYTRLINWCNTAAEDIYAGVVDYIDYFDEQSFIPENNGFNFLMHKDLAYSHEMEVRAIVSRNSILQINPTFDINKLGINIKINNFSDLIENIYISPLADDWFMSIVKSILEKFDINIPVAKSQLAEPPVF